jgi:protoporphyrinogen oxidase
LNVSIFEASSRWGGWINSKKVQVGNDTVYFEKGPRTLRLSTGEEKEINSIEFVIY